MPIPSTVADLSTTASSNYPSGTESPNQLDDYHRALCSIVRQVSDAKVTTGTLATTATTVSATDKILGRQTAGSGATEEITCTAAGRALLDDASASAQRTTLGLGTAAVLDVGTSASQVVQLTAAAKLPAVDGSLLTNMPSGIPTQTGNSGKFLTTDGTNASWASLAALSSMTAQTPSGVSNADFTSIPSTAKRITVIFSGSSLSGSASFLIRGGVSGTPETSGYTSAGNFMGSGTSQETSTAGYVIPAAASGANTLQGSYVLNKVSGNTWVGSGTFYLTGSSYTVIAAGTKTLSGTLDMIRITNTASDTFDAGTINVFYE